LKERGFIEMPAADLTQLVRSSIERNSGIPAILDAYSEFVDSPIGALELQDLESVFAAILGNLSERFPQIASRKAAQNARNDIVSFLAVANNNPDRVKTVLREELRNVNRVMVSSIAERFSRMNTEERRAIDATLRLVRRSPEEIIFRVDIGKGIEQSGPEFEKFFVAVKAQSPTMKELRFQNLIVEKAIFNKLILKSKDRRDNTIWVPSYFAKENADLLIERAGLVSEHLLLSRLREMKAQGNLDTVRQTLARFVENQGVLTAPIDVTSEIADYVTKIAGKYVVMTPLELDDVSALFAEEEQEDRKLREAEREKQMQIASLERSRVEQLEMERQQQRRRPAFQVPIEEQWERKRSGESIYVGKKLDIEQFIGAINKRLPEKEIVAQVKTTGEYFVDLSEITQAGISIVGSSGSGRSTTLRRILDGLASAVSSSSSSSPPNATRIFVIDQKGEHRGIAWKYKWDVLAFAQDSQSHQMRLPSFLNREDEEGGSELAAGLLQEWLLEAGISCTEQQRARIASIIRSQSGTSPNAESISKAIIAEPELAQVGPKLAKNILSKNAMSRIFTEDLQAKLEICEKGQSAIFDVSGRGLRDPTTREERLIVSVLILKHLLDSNAQFSIIVLEDVLDRFKSESLRKKVVHYVSRLREKGNTIIATSRSQIRDFVGGGSLEILHRLSGEKVINEEISGFKMTYQIKNLAIIVTFLPRGYAFTSSMVAREGNAQSKNVPSAAIKVEPLQFSTSV
jgi:hypothetical protein